jgi:hypothetical protein
VSPKTPPRSLPSANVFPAGIPGAIETGSNFDGDWFESKWRYAAGEAADPGDAPQPAPQFDGVDGAIRNDLSVVAGHLSMGKAVPRSITSPRPIAAMTGPRRVPPYLQFEGDGNTRL